MTGKETGDLDIVCWGYVDELAADLVGAIMYDVCGFCILGFWGSSEGWLGSKQSEVFGDWLDGG
jgi:hypothetical protein